MKREKQGGGAVAQGYFDTLNPILPGDRSPPPFHDKASAVEKTYFAVYIQYKDAGSTPAGAAKKTIPMAL